MLALTPTDAGLLLAGLTVAVLPGSALLLALGIRRPLLFAALAPTATIGVLLALASTAAAVGLPFGAATASVIVGLLLVAGLVSAVRSGIRLRPPRPLAATVVGGGLVVLGAGTGVATWMRGLGRLSTVGQEHDLIVHHVVVAYMARSGRAAPWQILPADVLTGEPVSFYPAGAHLAPALLSDTGVSTVAALNALTVSYLAIGWSVSTAALTFVAARRLRLGRGGAWLAAGVASIVAAGLYRPVFQLMHDGGIYPTAVALTLAPGLLAALLVVPPRGWRVPVALGFGAAGIVAAYPGAAVTVGLSLVAWLLGDLVAPDGRRHLLRSVLPLGLAATVGLVVAAPFWAQALGSVAGVSAFPPDSSSTAFSDALGSAIGMPYGGFIASGRAIGQGVVTALCLIGVVAVAWQRRGLGLVAAWAAWVLVVFGAFRSPGVGIEAPVTGFFYNALLRVWSHPALFVAPLAALAVVIVGAGIARAVRRTLPVAARGWRVATAATTAAAAAFMLVPGQEAAEITASSVAARYGDPDFARVTSDDRAAIAWLDQRVQPGQRVLNSANDGSTFLFVEAGIPVVNIFSLGTGAAPYTYRLLEFFDQYPDSDEIRQLLINLQIAWVYVDEVAPAIGAAGAPYGWYDGAGAYSTAPGLRDLEAIGPPGLDVAFRRGSVTVYELDLATVRQL